MQGWLHETLQEKGATLKQEKWGSGHDTNLNRNIGND